MNYNHCKFDYYLKELFARINVLNAQIKENNEKDCYSYLEQ